MGDAWQIEWHEELDSTNRLAVARVLECWAGGRSAEGLVIAASRQTAGRGQHGRAWASPAGGLYLSAVVEDVSPAVRHRLALVAGVAVAAAIESADRFEPRIRWPNDILLQGRKVAGILCEAVAQGDRWASVVGVGVNVNMRVADLGPGLLESATSLHDEDGAIRDVKELAGALLTRLHAQLDDLRRGGLAVIVQRVRKLDALKGERVRMVHRGIIVEGTGAGISADGELILQLADGTFQAFADGSISAADSRLSA